MNNDMMDALELLARDQGVPPETILDALANALVSAYKRTPGAAEEARVTIDPENGKMTVYGQELDEDGVVIREWEDTPEDFGRIAAQTAKQVIKQRLRDAKREQVFELYEGREGDLVTGIVQQSDHRFAILDLGNAEAIMPSSERIPYERLERNNRVKAYILEVRQEGKGPQIVVSRSHPEFIRSLFELEVPELVDGDVEIKVIAREAGHRTKIAVASNDPNVDPVGACVGARGSRVRQVVNELRGEKVDIVEWRDDAPAFIAEALSPARVKEVRINEEESEAVVIVPDHQLSLAIGKEGQNARLAARLTGYRIDIRSESQDLGLDVETDDAEASDKTTETTESEAQPEAGESASGDTGASAVPDAEADESASPVEAASGEQDVGADADETTSDESNPPADGDPGTDTDEDSGTDDSVANTKENDQDDTPADA
ncbi:MAG: transcription termination/antitermination protein NusA [Acidobacteria bacterium]|nr:transcription termination/antitermination protein NusA [Acidobacteriota bacterium]MCH8986014.1 transcription termination/antitermination protein NusA [Acidobacteriota bacterium]